jgi:hypothetical protein
VDNDYARFGTDSGVGDRDGSGQGGKRGNWPVPPAAPGLSCRPQAAAILCRMIASPLIQPRVISRHA